MKKNLSLPKPKKKKEKYKQSKADALFSLIIRARGRCEAIGKDDQPCGGRLQAAHIVTRGYSALRYDEKNALCLCASHHRHYHSYPHKWWRTFLPTHYPDQLAYVLARAKPNEKRSDFKEIISRLRLRLDQPTKI